MSADLSRDLDQHRGYLLRVARLQLRDEALAEDVVQETWVAVLRGLRDVPYGAGSVLAEYEDRLRGVRA